VLNRFFNFSTVSVPSLKNVDLVQYEFDLVWFENVV